MLKNWFLKFSLLLGFVHSLGEKSLWLFDSCKQELSEMVPQFLNKNMSELGEQIKINKNFLRDWD